MRIAAKKLWFSLAVLLSIQILQVIFIVHHESLTFDEGDHMYAGYQMLHSGDYGLNPEHPPLAKMLAALPLLGRNLWNPPALNTYFKDEAYRNGFLWWERNDGPNHALTLTMRLSVGILAAGLSLLVFFMTREWFGDRAALIALLLLVFDPNILAHSALVTTDMSVTLFFLASIYAFYHYVTRPSVARLLLCGLSVGLLLASKHSGILIAPMLFLLAAWELVRAPKNERFRMAQRMTGVIAAAGILGVLVLWCFYGFRYQSRPAGLSMSVTLADYVAPLGHFSRTVVMSCAHLHLLPESYLIGLVDVKRMAQLYPTFVLGRVYAHGVWWYFPLVILIKSTLSILVLCCVALWAFAARRLSQRREVFYLLLPGAVYLSVAMLSGMNIGARHILLLFAMAAMLAGAGASALLEGHRKIALCAVILLLAAHVASSLSVFPNSMAYANEAWGGAKNTYKLLSDSNVDWAQQLISVKAWQDRHPSEECWFAYFANPEIDPAAYGIRCHKLPNPDTVWMGGADVIAPQVSGSVLISAGDLSGCEWPDAQLNPYRVFQNLKPEEEIDYGVLVYRGSFQMHQAAAQSRAINAYRLQKSGNAPEALAMAREAVQIEPAEIISLTALGDIAAAQGRKEEARQAWMDAIRNARKLEPDAQVSLIPDLEAKLKKR